MNIMENKIIESDGWFAEEQDIKMSADQCNEVL